MAIQPQKHEEKAQYLRNIEESCTKPQGISQMKGNQQLTNE